MKPSDLTIGSAFSVGGHSLWRCTDLGTRTVIGIRLDSDVVCTVSVHVDGHHERLPDRVVDPRREKPTWLNGPPYAVAETVFDEYDLPCIRPVPEAEVMDWRPGESDPVEHGPPPPTARRREP